MRIALLADLFDLIAPESHSDLAILTFELAQGFKEYIEKSEALVIDLVAKRGSWNELPLISIDLQELPALPSGELDRFARQETAYCQLILSGLLNDYDVVHSLAPIVTPLQLLNKMGIPVVQTIVTNKEHPSTVFPPFLLNKKQLERISANAHFSQNLGIRHIPAAVDLQRFNIPIENRADYVLWLTDKNEQNAALAGKIAEKLNLPLRIEIESEPIKTLQNAAFLLDLSTSPTPIGNQWALRALACGNPVVKWTGSELDELLEPPGIGVVVPQNDVGLLIKKAKELPRTDEVALLRRQLILALHNKRSVIKQYLECYERLLNVK